MRALWLAHSTATLLTSLLDICFCTRMKNRRRQRVKDPSPCSSHLRMLLLQSMKIRGKIVTWRRTESRSWRITESIWFSGLSRLRHHFGVHLNSKKCLERSVKQVNWLVQWGYLCYIWPHHLWLKLLRNVKNLRDCWVYSIALDARHVKGTL